jgi:multidrug resistance efflux pump
MSTTPATTESPDRLRKLVRITLAVLLVMFLYHLFADRITPYTTQANIETFLVQIAPDVSGRVVEVGARDNGAVRKGQPLFRIDADPYRIALQSAQANLSAATQNEDASAADVRVADAQLQFQREDLAASQQLGKIVLDLSAKRALSETAAIRARADIAKTKASISKAEAEAARARIRLGEGPDGNPQVRQALAALEQAKLDLQRTSVVAPADGVVTNLRLAPGQFANRGQPVLSFIAGGPRWVSAAMRENQLGRIAKGNRALVVFDDHPGRVFRARVESVGWGVTQGGEAPTGTLPDVAAPAGWLREPQRFPVRVVLDPPEAGDKPLPPGRAGAQANVVVLTKETSVFNPLARVWIRIVSWMSFLR